MIKNNLPTAISAIARVSALIASVSLISACNLTPEWLRAEEQQQLEEQQIASELAKQCEDHAEHALEETCLVSQEGIIPTEHPVDDIEIPLSTDAEVAEITDLWVRVRNQLSFDVPDDKRVTEQRNWYLKHPHYLLRVSKRAEPFLYHIIDAIEQRNLPMELALLPIVESAFDPFAYTHGRAAGMWQFIPGTGKRFGLKQEWWYDGRRDVMASTRAALDYLEYLLKMFDGNWLHALAAYNSGEGRVLNAIKYNKRKGLNTDFWALDLPKETRAYVPKLLALKDILVNHREMDESWFPIANQPLTELVDVGSQIDLAKAADMAGLTVKELHALNPGFNRWATDPDGPHHLLLPVDRVEAFKTKLAALGERDRLNWVRHKIRSGDSLLKLAKEYHTTVDVIRKVNNINGNTIVAGDFVLIPVALKSLESYSLSEEQRLLATQDKRRARYQLTHTVVSGDNFWDLSRSYKVNMRSLAKWNGMAPTDPLQLGQKLVVWVDKVSDEQRKDAVMRSLTYTVRNGDSLAKIAGKFKVRVADLTKWNQLDSKKYLQPGQKLKVYVDVTRT
ncbi:LysM peptidoglycan-binding domain-containing protein [Pseudobowmanella zhangzhouensis]|uniref:LysM peptidoglycan-binding domain-containing protein n=1 Tax=Pseudobowmanella zhangzhouensis TaxID=1537679 RepID=A0ABW1XMJ0_9ALTE